MNSNTKDYTPKTPAEWFLYALKGAIVGVGGILPGVSGGVLCVAFGIYKPLMEVLANPIKGLKQHIQMFIPFAVGGGLGFVALARIIGDLMEKESNLMISAFVGLIFGVFPALFREAGQEGRNRASWIAFAISTCCTLAMAGTFLFLEETQGVSVTPDFFWYFISGLLFGVGVIVPGMSSSSPLIFLGLYGPMTAGIGAFDFAVLVPVALGILGSVFMLARSVQKLFDKYYSITFHCIMGFVLASTLPIIPYEFVSFQEGISCLGLGIFCCVLAYGMDQWGTNLKKEKNIDDVHEDEQESTTDSEESDT
ncbi:MAG: DUF368 domain-containing protein [Eubacteriales bacterium]